MPNRPDDVIATTAQLLAANYAHAAERLSRAERSKLASQFASYSGLSSLTEEQQQNVTKILQMLVNDVEMEVRKALAVAAARNPAFPHSIATELAADFDDVAIPMLEVSSLFTDADLLEIIETYPSVLKLTAIARRPEVSGLISSVLVESSDSPDVIKVLLENTGACIDARCFEDIIDRHGALAPIQEAIVGREELPAVAIMKLVPRITRALVDRLVDRHRVPADVAKTLALDTQQHATLGLATGLSKDALDSLIDELIACDAITPSFLMRALCVGHLEFFCRTLSAMTFNSTDYVTSRITESPEEELPPIWRGASLPEEWIPAACAAIAVITDSALSAANLSIADHKARIMEGIAAKFAAMNVDLTQADRDYLFAKPVVH
jgi:uncharacterized protein (DUF2336 family)